MTTTKKKEDEKGTRLTTPRFVLSYPHLFKAQKPLNPNAPPQFSGQAIFRPADFDDREKKLWGAMMKEIRVQIADVFKIKGENRVEVEKALTKKYPKAWIALRDGTEGDFETRTGYGPGTKFARLHTTSPPGVVDASRSIIHPSEGNADEIYPGVVCRATITIKAYDHKESGGKGYTFYLGNIQKIKDGARLDSRVAAEDDFDEDLDGAWLDQEDDTGDAGEGSDDDFG